MAVRVAAASSDGKVINQHFGRATQFLIFDIEEKSIRIVERRFSQCVCESGDHDDNRLADTVDLLRDCRIILVSRIGPGAKAAVNTAGLEVYEIGDFIEAVLINLQKSTVFKRQFMTRSDVINGTY